LFRQGDFVANKYHTYFGQIITNSELNEIFDALFAGVDRFIQDFGYHGIVVGGVAAQHSPLNLTVDIDGPTIVYDQDANRMSFASTVNVNCALDENGASTAVVGGSNSKYLSLFMEFTSTPSDPRTDDLGDTVYFKDIESYRINVVQGAEAASSPTRPALRADQILLADVLLPFGATTINNAAISSTRAQVAYDLTGTPVAIRAKGFTAALQSMLDAVNTALTTVGAIDVDTMVADALTGSPTAIPSGQMHTILQTMLNAVNTARTNADAAQAEVDTYPPPGKIMLYDIANQLQHSGSIFLQAASADEVQFGCTVLPADDPYAGAGAPNKWKHVATFKYTLNGGFFSIWTGGDGTKGNFALTLNALWTVSTQQWTQRASGPTRPSYALIFYEDKARFAYKSAGTANWTDWTPGAGTTEVDNLAVNQGISVSGNIQAVTQQTFGSNASDGNVITGGEFKYGTSSGPALKSRTTMIDLRDDFSILHGTSKRYSIIKPAGAVLGQVDVKVSQSDGVVTATIQLVREHTYDFGGGGTPTSVIVDSDSTSAGAGVTNVSSNFNTLGTLTVDDAEEYALIVSAVGGSGTLTVLGARITWQDPGPVNK
jgi:hypothetical protein